MRRGVLGGSFDPVHNGHLVIAEAAADQLDLAVVHLIPTHRHPLKREGHRASPDDRCQMLHLAVAQSARLVVDDRELRRGGASYTVDTLRELRREYPEDALCFLVGEDAASDLSRWHEASELYRLAEIVILTRQGSPSIDGPSGASVVAVPRVPISATQVRSRVAQGNPIADLVPLSVAEYITAKGLYR